MTRMTDIKNKRQAKSEEGIYSRKANVSRLMSYFRPHILSDYSSNFYGFCN